jgi:c-di-GMP-related signal transduction protein
MSSTQVVVGRQPVFDANLGVIGYELLFRPLPDATTAQSAVHDGDEMTTAVFHSALSIGLDRLVGDKLIFCNADRGLLTGEVPIPLPPERTVIEVLESVRFDDEIDAGCRALRAAGYRLALDDFVWFPGAEGLLAHASVVKIDVQKLSHDQVLALMDRCRDFDVQLLAEKVETPDELSTYRALGFDLFQGYALARPTTVTGASLDAPAVAVLRLAAAVMDERTDMAEIEEILRHDPALTLQLLEVAAIGTRGGLRRPVRSIREALVMLGTRRMRSWITLLLLRSSRGGASDDLVTVLARARMCELLAASGDPDYAAFGFTAGMVSALDRLLGLPATQLRDVLPLDAQLLDAAFGTSSAMGQLVHKVIDFESGGAIAPGEDAELRAVAARALDWAVRSSGVVEAA